MAICNNSLGTVGISPAAALTVSVHCSIAIKSIAFFVLLWTILVRFEIYCLKSSLINWCCCFQGVVTLWSDDAGCDFF